MYLLSTDQECGVWSQLIKLLMGKVCNYWTGRGGSILTDDGGDDVKQLLSTCMHLNRTAEDVNKII